MNEQLEQIKEWFATFLNYRDNQTEPEPKEYTNKKNQMHKGFFKPYTTVNVLKVDKEKKLVWQEGHFTPQPLFLFHEIEN